MASHREILKANRRERRKRYFRRSVTIVVFSALILLFGGWYFWNSPTFALDKVVIVGAEKVSVEHLTQTVNNILSGKYFGLFREKVNWFYPRAELLARLHQQFPELAAIDVLNISWGTLRVEVSEREPLALWCENDCYYMDDSGLLYAPAPRFSNSPFFTLTGPSLPITIGSRPLSISGFQHLFELRAAINRLLQATPDFSGQTTDAVSLVEPVDFAFNVRNVRLTSDSWQLLATRRDTVETAMAHLVAAFSTPSFLTDYRSSGIKLESLDIRFDRKVFYKFVP